MERVVILGRGGAGKSTAAAQLGRLTRLPVIELDKHFWSAGVTPIATDDWVRMRAAPGVPAESEATPSCRLRSPR